MKKPWTLRKRVFLSSVAITGIVTLLLGLFNVMELYVTDRNTTAFETYMNLSTFLTASMKPEAIWKNICIRKMTIR